MQDLPGTVNEEKPSFAHPGMPRVGETVVSSTNEYELLQVRGSRGGLEVGDRVGSSTTEYELPKVSTKSSVAYIYRSHGRRLSVT